MVKHNNVVPNIKLHKDYQRWIKTHFDQPMKAKRRSKLRRLRAATKAPRPAKKLRPIVSCPTQRYNMKIRAGRGFSPLELKAAGLNVKYARTIGIAVDERRRNRSQEGLHRNVKRLKKYMQCCIVFPLKPKGKQMKDREKVIAFYLQRKQSMMKMALYKNYLGEPLPVRNKKKIVSVVKIDEVPDFDAFGTMRSEWCLKKHHFKWRRTALRRHAREKLKAARDAKKKAKKAMR